MVGDILTEATRRLQAVHQRLVATMDVDATNIEGNKGFALLAGSVTKRRLRADSALYEEETLTWLGSSSRFRRT